MLTPHISVVHVPVNAIGKKRSSVFFLPKLSLSLICFGPSLVFVDKVKSGAFVPTASGIENFSIRSTSDGSKKIGGVESAIISDSQIACHRSVIFYRDGVI